MGTSQTLQRLLASKHISGLLRKTSVLRLKCESAGGKMTQLKVFTLEAHRPVAKIEKRLQHALSDAHFLALLTF